MEHIESNTKEIAFERLNAKDKIVIETKNSQYRFLLLDPSEKRGLLSGGSLGERQREAILVGTLAANTKSFALEKPVVKVGDRLLFCLIDGNEAESFFTSGIRHLDRVRGSEGRRATAATSRGSQS